MIILSAIQINELFHWQFNLFSILSLGYHPLLLMVNNGCFIFELISKHYHNSTSKPTTNEKHPTPTQPTTGNLLPQTRLCLDTGDDTPSTDNITFDSDSSLVYLDTCATDSMTPFFEDFIPGTFVSIENLPNVTGSGGKLKIKGVGTASYVVHDDND